MSTSRSPLLPPLSSSSSSRYWIQAPLEVSHTFHAHSPLNAAGKVTVQSAGVGLLVSAVQNALEKADERHDKGAMGILTRTGGTIGFFAALGFTFAYTQAFTANVRETDDALNSAAGGCAAGFIAGVRARSLPMAVGACAAMGTMIGTFNAAGNALTGTDRLALPRPEREERRKAIFKQPKPATEDAAVAL